MNVMRCYAKKGNLTSYNTIPKAKMSVSFVCSGWVANSGASQPRVYPVPAAAEITAVETGAILVRPTVIRLDHYQQERNAHLQSVKHGSKSSETMTFACKVGKNKDKG